MKKLSLLVLVFFLVESEESPKHVAGLMRCQNPKGAPANHVPRLMEAMREFDDIGDPFYLASFVGYFLGGYFFYAALFVGIGSVCNSLKEAQNLIQPLVLMLIVPDFWRN